MVTFLLLFLLLKTPRFLYKMASLPARTEQQPQNHRESPGFPECRKEAGSMHKDVFQIFFFIRPGTAENYDYVKKGKAFASSYSIPIVRVQADFAHLKLPIKNVSENKCM